MTVLDIVLPESIAVASGGGDSYNTSIFTSLSGYEQRVSNRNAPLGRWTISTPILRKGDIQDFIDIYHQCKGRLYGFLFKDWSDYKLDKQVIGTANGMSFPIVRNYGANPGETRKVGKLVKNTAKFYRGSYRLYKGFSLKNTDNVGVTGEVVTFSSVISDITSSNPLSVSGEYYKTVRFDVDGMNIINHTETWFSWDTIGIRELALS